MKVAEGYGLPGWAILIIGAGTIVAALISAIQAVTVAFINARANQRLAIENAHRVRRAEEVATLNTLAARCIHLANSLVLARLSRRSTEEIRQIFIEYQALGRAASQELKQNVSSPIPLPTLKFGIALGHGMISLDRSIKEALETSSDVDLTTAAKDIDVLAQEALHLASAYQYALDGYIFGLKTRTRAAEWMVRKIRFRRWVRRRSSRRRAP